MRSAIEHILGPNGPIAAAMNRRLAAADGQGSDRGVYEPRPQQIEMARAVERALNAKDAATGRSGRLMVEAGTGVGKSFAYLVPAILRCVALGQRVVIATNTIALQEQLVTRDIPFLMETLNEWGMGPVPVRTIDTDGQVRDRGDADQHDDEPPADGHADARPAENAAPSLHPLVPVLCKGRGNYVSIRRLEMASQRQERLFFDDAQRRSLHVIEDWCTGTLDGTLSTLPPLERPGVWDRVQSDSDNCMGRKCPRYTQCFYQRARRAMQLGNLLICNHALFFSDLALRRQGDGAGFLPEYHHVILDEAHGVEDAACDHFGLTLSEGRVEHLASSLYHENTGRGYLSQLAGILDSAKKPGASVGGLSGGAISGTVQALSEAVAISRAFFDELLALHRSGELRAGRLPRPNMIDQPLGAAMRTLAARLKVLKGLVGDALGERGEQDQFELNAYAMRAEAIAFDADALVGQAVQGAAYWIEVAGGGGGGGGRSFGVKVKLCCAPVDVAPILKEHLFGQKIGVVLTSATIALAGSTGGASPSDDETDEERAARIAKSFTHVKSRLGCEDADTLLLGSPFDYATQAKVIVDLAAANPREGGGSESYASEKQGYADALAHRVLHHVRLTKGGAFVLFTSFDSIRRVTEAIGGDLEMNGMPLLVQGRDGTPGQVLAKFRENPRSVLFGAASFWQGVDVKGDALRNVVITRLPFDPPDRPLVTARHERIKSLGGDPFNADSLPRAILRFKQGFGRLIRSASDTGRVVILDPRVVTARYGRRFLDALPAGVPIEVWEE